jgi:diacylglycerol kinase family enzyme
MSWRVFVLDGSDPRPIGSALAAEAVSHRFVEVAPSALREAVTSELEQGFTRLAVTGGDAAAASVVDCVIAAGFEGRVDLALLPGRRPSELARTFALDPGLAASVRRIARGDRYPIDVGVIDAAFGRRVFLSSVATGVLAGGPHWFPLWPRPIRSAGPVTVHAGTTVVQTVGSGVLVLNGQFWGDWIGAPRSTLIDGVVDLQLFSGRRRMLSRLRPAFRTGQHVRAVGVRRMSIATATVDQPSNWWINVDGIRLGRGAFSVATVAGAVAVSI